ncbi:MAG TPA: S24 family peptidase [Chloroflexia bacterium]|nr:S24 family peptidase [Chloroflexia bacterium]
MVIRLPGMSPQRGPQPGPEPVWARFNRAPGKTGTVAIHAYKPEVAGYRLLGAEHRRQEPDSYAERNRHNSSVYVSTAERQRKTPGTQVARLPVIGEIAAGQYDVTVAFQEYDCLDYENGVAIDKALARGGAYALRVRGTSMTHAGIEPGDVVVIRPQDWANDGDFVVANYSDGDAGGSEGLATLKRFYKRRDHIFLQSATASTDPIRLFATRKPGAPDCDPVRVQGVVTMVLKASSAI